VYQGKEKASSDTSTNNNIDTKNLDRIANLERKFLQLEEKSRLIEGLIEELNHFKIKIDELTQQNSLLQSKLDLISHKNINQVTTINEQESIQDDIIEEYPIYPGMPNKKDDNEINIIEEGSNESTVKVLAKINPDNGKDEIIKKTINTEPAKLDTITEKEIVSVKKDNSIVSNTNPEEIYQRAYNILSKGDIEAAQIAFKTFIKDYPDHNLTSNAYYWLGQTFYVRQNYNDAAITFVEGYKKFPKGSKAADQLFKLAISLDALKKITDACTTFKKLDQEFPNAPSRISNRAKTYKEKLGCK
jgi:tol-pal system protein YbgF